MLNVLNDIKYIFQQASYLPPIRSRAKEKCVTKENKKTENTKRIKSYDYTSWDKFDVVSSYLYNVIFHIRLLKKYLQQTNVVHYNEE